MNENWGGEKSAIPSTLFHWNAFYSHIFSTFLHHTEKCVFTEISILLVSVFDLIFCFCHCRSRFSHHSHSARSKICQISHQEWTFSACYPFVECWDLFQLTKKVLLFSLISLYVLICMKCVYILLATTKRLGRKEVETERKVCRLFLKFHQCW